MTVKSKEGGRRAALAVVLGLVLATRVDWLRPRFLAATAYPIVSPYAELSAAWSAVGEP